MHISVTKTQLNVIKHVHNELAVVYSRKSKHALNTLLGAYNEDAGNMRILAEIACVNVIEKNYSCALNKINIITKENPEYLQVYKISEQAYIGLGLYKEAKDSFIKYSTITDNQANTNAYEITLLDVLPKLQSNLSRSKIYELAINLLGSNKIGVARNILAGIYAEDQNNLYILFLLARIDLIELNYMDALHKAKVLITRVTDYRRAYTIARQVAIGLKDFKSAKDYILAGFNLKSGITTQTKNKTR